MLSRQRVHCVRTKGEYNFASPLRVRAKSHPSSARDRKLCTPPSHLSQCIKEPHSHLALFTIGGSKASNPAAARLEFIQNMEYKFIELLSLDFSASVEHTVRQQITYRYNANKVRARCVHPHMRSLYHQQKNSFA